MDKRIISQDASYLNRFEKKSPVEASLSKLLEIPDVIGYDKRERER